MIILEENFKWHLEAFASELYIYIYIYISACVFSNIDVFSYRCVLYTQMCSYIDVILLKSRVCHRKLQDLQIATVPSLHLVSRTGQRTERSAFLSNR